MSDYYTDVSISRGDVSGMICDGDEEHAMWILADVSSRMEPTVLHSAIDYIDADPREVAKFFRDLADLIDAGLEAEAA